LPRLTVFFLCDRLRCIYYRGGKRSVIAPSYFVFQRSFKGHHKGFRFSLQT